jgi:hypothetical protein
VVELERRDLLHRRAPRAGQLDAPVAGPGVHDDDLDLVVDALGGDGVQAAGEVLAAVLDGDQNGDHGAPC